MANEPLAKTVLDSNSQAEDSLILQNKQLAALHSLSARFNYGN